MSATGWGSFAVWAFAGALGAFALISMLSIGIFIVPFAVLALNLLTRRGSPGAEALGAVTGAGLVGVVVWPLNRDYRPCPEGPISGEFECGGFDATPWLVVGLALAAMGVTA